MPSHKLSMSGCKPNDHIHRQVERSGTLSGGITCYPLHNLKGKTMENQHRQIKGYRELSQDEIDALNEIRAVNAEIGELMEKLQNIEGLDQKWFSIGVTDLHTGLLALSRAVAQPTLF